MASRSHAQRVAQGRAAFLAAHPHASMTEATAFARGHWGTPEHGVTVKEEPGGPESPIVAIYEVYAAQDVKRALGAISEPRRATAQHQHGHGGWGPTARITITVHDAYGTRIFFKDSGRHAGRGMTVGHAREVLWQYSRDFARGMVVLLSGKAGSYSDEKIKLKFKKVQTIQIAVIDPERWKDQH